MCYNKEKNKKLYRTSKRGMIAKNTRAEKRACLESTNFPSRLIKVIYHFFPNLIDNLKNVSDKRHQGYVIYDNYVILMLRILMSIFYIKSMRSATEKLNNSNFIKNFSKLCGNELNEIPHFNTVNNYLRMVEPNEIQAIIQGMVNQLIRNKIFNSSRIFDKKWQVIIDGTQIFSSEKPLDEKCLKKNYKDENGEITRTIYSYYVLEAKIVFGDKIIASIGTEFVENESDDVSKQDCELKAAYRLMDKIKAVFPKLPICICADALYAAKPVLNKCTNQHHWAYVIRFKDGCIPSVYEEYENLIKYDGNEIREKITLPNTKKAERVYNYVNDIDYDGNIVNIAECIEKIDETEKHFVYMTNKKINDRNVKEICDVGRKRWKIENEGFDIQKNHGYELEHNFSNDYNAQKNHYFLIQIAHIISQLFENSDKEIKKFKLTLVEIHEKILMDFKTKILSDDVFRRERCQIRFV